MQAAPFFEKVRHGPPWWLTLAVCAVWAAVLFPYFNRRSHTIEGDPLPYSPQHSSTPTASLQLAPPLKAEHPPVYRENPTYLTLPFAEILKLSSLSILEPETLQLDAGLVNALRLTPVQVEQLNGCLRQCVDSVMDSERAASQILEDGSGGNYLLIRRDATAALAADAYIQQSEAIAPGIGSLLANAVIHSSFIGETESQVIAFGADPDGLVMERWTPNSFANNSRGGLLFHAWEGNDMLFSRSLPLRYAHLLDIHHVIKNLRSNVAE